MGLRELLLEALANLAPQIDETKAQLERDPAAIAISTLLSEARGLELVEYVIDELKRGREPIYSASAFLEEPKFSQLVQHFYCVQDHQALDVLLAFYHQLWGRHYEGGNAPQEIFRAIAKLENSEAVSSKTLALNVCLDCCAKLEEGAGVCDQCGRGDLLLVYRLVLAQSATTALRRGQYLEFYVKECLEKSGVELVGWDADKHGHKAYVSIVYQVDGEPVDVDVHGIAQPLAILLCEVKTSPKITMNDIRRVETLFNRLVAKTHDLSGFEAGHLKLFIITGEFDQNIPRKAAQRRHWELLDRYSIPNLTEEFRRVQSEL